MSERSSYITITQTQDCLDWLTKTVGEHSDAILVPVDLPSINRVVDLSDSIGVSGIFVQLTADNYRHETLLIEGLVAAKPFLPVVVVAERGDPELLLSAMRVGARDFIAIGSRSSEVASVMKRLVPKNAGAFPGQARDEGRLTAIVSARPGSDAPMLALHMALAIQETEPTLLLDLGLPHGDATMYLGVNASYSFIDAIRSLRRIDATLIQTGFGQHKSGLTLLSMPEEPVVGVQLTSADVYVLLRTLRRHFSHVVVNLGGVARSEFLTLLLSNADNLIVLIEQSVPSCRQNLQLVNYLRNEKINLEHAGLVVDRYLPRMPPDAESIAQSFGLPLMGTLASSGMARLAAINSGESMFEISPGNSYALSVRKLAQQITGNPAARENKSLNVFRRLLSALTLKASEA